MKKPGLLALLFFLLVIISAQFQPGLQASKSATQKQDAGAQSDTGRAEAEEGIKHLLVAQVEAWNRGDLEGFMNGYWHSPNLTFFSGAAISSGWQAALDRYKNRYQGSGKEMGHLEFQDLSINLLGRQAAFVTGKWELTMSDGKKPHGLFTLILKKLQNGWRIVHDHTSE